MWPVSARVRWALGWPSCMRSFGLVSLLAVTISVSIVSFGVFVMVEIWVRISFATASAQLLLLVVSECIARASLTLEHRRAYQV